MDVVVFSCTGSPYIVGRDPKCDFVYSEPFVSRSHFSVSRVYGGLCGKLEVFGKNGVFLNGEKVECKKSEYLKNGDCITLGCKTFVYECDLLRRINARETDGIMGEYPEGELSTESVEIESPPLRKQPEKPSIFMAAGPALTMAIPIALGLKRWISVLSAIIAAVWAAMNVFVRRKKQKKEEQRRKAFYLKYIEEKRNEVRKRNDEEIAYLRRVYPAVEEILFKGGGIDAFWNKRRHNVKDARMVRIGTGDAKPSYELIIPKERPDMIDDSLKSLPQSIFSKEYRLVKAPLLTEISIGQVVGIVFDEKKTDEICALIMQLALKFSPEEMVITVKDNAVQILKRLEFLAILPHFKLDSDSTHTDDYRMYPNEMTHVIIGSLSMNLLKEADVCFDKWTEGSDTLNPKAAYSAAVIVRSKWENSCGEKHKLPTVVGLDVVLKEGSLCKKQSNFADERICTTLDNIRFPIGVGNDNTITYLDISEKADGPHGLIAGTTGSGKSELITTVILSAAINYPPDELCFFLIDYKGGGMANNFCNLPHVIGRMTNLSMAQERRVRISLKAENVRRQEMFAKHKVNSITDYNRGYAQGRIPDKMPHIVIVVDEFAELKKEHPEFMDSLISISQIGRSLGIHLILSTQKPSGVVDEKIRSNTKFKIALRMEDVSDSHDVIGCAKAAFLEGCGKGYIKRGSNSEPKLFLSAYSMATMKKEERLLKLYEDPFLQRSAEIMKWYEGVEESAETKSCFSYYMEKIEENSKSIMVKTLCPAELSSSIPYKPGIVALSDDPGHQRYLEIAYDPKRDGMLLAIGDYGSGTDEFLFAAALDLIETHNKGANREYSLYVCDFSEEMLKELERCPDCGGVVTAENGENADMMLRFIFDELKRHRRRESKGGYDEEKNIENLLLIIANYGEFIKNCSQEAAGMVEEIVKYGKKEGVFLAISAFDISPGEICGRLAAGFDKTFVFGNRDIYSTSQILSLPPREIFPIRDVKGRGLVNYEGNLLEFQTVSVADARIYSSKWEGYQKERGEVLTYPHIPNKPTLENFLHRAVLQFPPRDGPPLRNALPVGFIRKSGQLYLLPVFKVKCILINSSSKERSTQLIENISIILARYNVTHYHFNPSNIEGLSNQGYLKESEDTTIKRIVLFNDLEKSLSEFYKKGVSAQEEGNICNLLDNTTPDLRKVTVIGVISDKINVSLAGRKAFEALMKKPYAITFSNEITSQRLFDYSYLSYSDLRECAQRDTAFVTSYDRGVFYGEIFLPKDITEDCG